MTRYEAIKAKSFDEMALFIESMLNGSICPMCDVKYCERCGENEPTFEGCSAATDDDCLSALKKWLGEEIAGKKPGEEVKHGKWIGEIVEKEDWKGKKQQYFNPCNCSICHEPSPLGTNYNYCPHCGAEMAEVGGR